MVFLIKWLEQRLTGTAVFVFVGIIRKTRKDPKIETIGMAANIGRAHLFIKCPPKISCEPYQENRWRG